MSPIGWLIYYGFNLFLTFLAAAFGLAVDRFETFWSVLLCVLVLVQLFLFLAYGLTPYLESLES